MIVFFHLQSGVIGTQVVTCVVNGTARRCTYVLWSECVPEGVRGGVGICGRSTKIIHGVEPAGIPSARRATPVTVFMGSPHSISSESTGQGKIEGATN